MTASAASAAITTAVPAGSGQEVLQASQNLFEHMAGRAQGMPQGASPNQIGDNLMSRLDGFIDRARRFSERVDGGLVDQPPVAQAAAGDGPTRPAPATVAEPQVNQLMHSLSLMFDYSIETQMVVRGATQVSGSANTLLRGQ